MPMRPLRAAILLLGLALTVTAAADDPPPAPGSTSVVDRVLQRVADRYRRAGRFARPALLVVNTPDDRIGDFGTLGLFAVRIDASRTEEGGRLELRATDDEGLLDLAANAAQWTVQQFQIPGRCLELPRPRIAGFGDLRTLVASIERDAMNPRPFLPLDLALLMDGSFDAILGAPVTSQSLPADDPLALVLDALRTHAPSPEQPADRLLLVGTAGRAAVAIGSTDATLALAAFDVDAADLGVLDDRGVRLTIGYVGGVVETGPAPEPPKPMDCSGEPMATPDAMANAVRLATLTELNRDRSGFALTAKTMRAGLAFMKEGSSKYAITKASIARLERLLAIAAETPDSATPGDPPSPPATSPPTSSPTSPQ